MPIRRKKGFTAKQSKRTSRRMNDSMYGSHVARSANTTRRRANASSVSFSNQRATSRASHGMVDTITPVTDSGESAAAYRRRSSQRRYIEDIQRKARRRRILTFVIAAVVVVGLAVGAGVLAFRGTVGSDMSLGDSDAKTVLVAAAEDDPVYTLIAVDLGAVATPLERSGPDVLLLARADKKDGTLALINIPADLRVTLTDGNFHHLYEASQSGDAALIDAVSKFSGVKVSHYVKVSHDNLVAMVDALGGVEVDVSQVIDDPHAGDVYLTAGKQTLDGHSALTFLRATNLKLGVADQLNNQLAFASSLLGKVFGEGGEVSFSTRLGSIDTFFQTDYSFDELVKLQEWQKGIAVDKITCVAVPGYMTATTGVVQGEASYYMASSNDVAAIIATLDEGGDVHANENAVANIDKSSFKVEVQNGADIVGAASATGDALKAAGFNVGEVGNAEQAVYNETLVIYKSDAAQAQAVINTLGIGRPVFASYYYKYDADVLVIIGSDYMPTS